MSHGKSICNQLKKVRKRIAEENDIPLKIAACTFQGECRGTCPRCEEEVRYLESALAERIRLGKVAAVAGLVMGFSLGANAQSDNPVVEPLQHSDTVNRAECSGTLRGRVLDGKTNEPLISCNVRLLQNNILVAYGITDWEGVYIIKSLPFGDYTLETSYMGFSSFKQSVTINKTGFTVMDISLARGSSEITIDVGETIPRNRSIKVDENGLIIDEQPYPMMGEIQVKLTGTPASQAEPNEQPHFYEDEQIVK